MKSTFSADNTIRINLTTHTVPDVKEISSSEYKYVLFGFTQKDRTGQNDLKWRNQFPQYLIWLLNRSAIHNAIVTGKTQYITGKGFEVVGVTDPVERINCRNFLKNINQYESADEVLFKTAFDFEVHNGFVLKIVGDKGKKSWSEVYHSDFADWRTNPERSEFYYTKDWSSFTPEKNADWEVLPAYDPNKWQAESILYYTGYRPSLKVYPFPVYVGALSSIESDYEIANFHLNNLKNGFTANTIVSMNNGTPKALPGQNQQQIEQKLKKKFTGTDNAGDIILMFSDGKDKEPTVLHLQPSDLDKQFDLLSKSVEQKILTGHQLTSPILVGIKTEGQLGGRQEMSDAWELFQNNYVSHRQKVHERVFNDLLEAKGMPRCLQIHRTDPIGLGLSDEQIIAVMNNNEVRERAGLPIDPNAKEDNTYSILQSLNPKVAEKVLEAMTPDEVRALAGLAPIGGAQAVAGGQIATAQAVNENIKNLTGRQHQAVLRIIRQFESGKLTKEQATTFLSTGYGLSADDINTLLKIQPEAFYNMLFEKEEVMNVFAEFGTARSEYEPILSKQVFSIAEINESEKFASDVSTLQQKILGLVKKDPLISSENLAKALKVTVDDIDVAIDTLINDELLKRSQKTLVQGTVPSLEITSDGADVISGVKSITTITAMYDYRKRPGVKGDTLIPTSRDFCRKIIGLDKYYSRKDIEAISEKLGYSVFDFAGGFWNDNGDTKPYCRHTWFLNLVRKKTNG